MSFGIGDLLKFSIPILLIGIVIVLLNNRGKFFPTDATVFPSTLTPAQIEPRARTTPVPPILNEPLKLSRSTIEFLDKTCNPPSTIVKNQEGEFHSTKFNLQKVIVISRHGDRGPLRRVIKSNTVDCSSSSLHYDNEKTNIFLELAKQMSHDVMRQSHINEDIFASSGDWLEYSSQQKCYAGMLTKVGVAQHIQLGEQLMSAYKHRLGLNGGNIREAMRINSTPYPRTYLSALSFLFGTYLSLNVDITNDLPDFHFGKEHGFFCGLDKTNREDYCHQKCAIYNIFKNKTVISKMFPKDEYEKMNQIRREIRKEIVETKEDERLFTNGRHILDALNLFHCHHSLIPLPERLSQPVDKLVDNIKRIIETLKSNEDHLSAALLSTYGLFAEFNKALTNDDPGRSNKMKFELYSGHDITLEALNTVLKYSKDNIIPPYASRLIFEIYQRGGTNNVYIKFIYNGEDVTANVIRTIQSSGYRVGDEELHFELLKAEELFNFITLKWSQRFDMKPFHIACGSKLHEVQRHKEEFSNEVEPDQNDDVFTR